MSKASKSRLVIWLDIAIGFLIIAGVVLALMAAVGP